MNKYKLVLNMSKKRLAIIAIVVCSLLLIISCSTNSTDSGDEESNILVFTAKDNNFKLSLHINEVNFSPDDRIDFYTTLEYIGESETLEITRGNPMVIERIYGDNIMIGPKLILGMGVIQNVTKGKVYRFEHERIDDDDTREFYSGDHLYLPTGNYTISIIFSYSVMGMESVDPIELNVNLVVE